MAELERIALQVMLTVGAGVGALALLGALSFG